MVFISQAFGVVKTIFNNKKRQQKLGDCQTSSYQKQSLEGPEGFWHLLEDSKVGDGWRKKTWRLRWVVHTPKETMFREKLLGSSTISMCFQVSEDLKILPHSHTQELLGTFLSMPWLINEVSIQFDDAISWKECTTQECWRGSISPSDF